MGRSGSTWAGARRPRRRWRSSRRSWPRGTAAAARRCTSTRWRRPIPTRPRSTPRNGWARRPTGTRRLTGSPRETGTTPVSPSPRARPAAPDTGDRSVVAPERTVGLILAAGAASRFGSPKVLASVGGATLLERVVAAARSGGLTRISVVLGPEGEGALRSAGVDLPSVQIVTNPRPEDGLSSSLRVGLASLDARS